MLAGACAVVVVKKMEEKVPGISIQESGMEQLVLDKLIR